MENWAEAPTELTEPDPRVVLVISAVQHALSVVLMVTAAALTWRIATLELSPWGYAGVILLLMGASVVKTK